MLVRPFAPLRRVSRPLSPQRRTVSSLTPSSVAAWRTRELLHRPHPRSHVINIAAFAALGRGLSRAAESVKESRNGPYARSARRALCAPEDPSRLRDATPSSALAAAHAVVIGAGGLGSAVVPILAAAGVGTITVVDDDLVDETNLHRQILHGAADVGRAKVDSAADSVRAQSPSTNIVAHRGLFTRRHRRRTALRRRHPDRRHPTTTRPASPPTTRPSRPASPSSGAPR